MNTGKSLIEKIEEILIQHYTETGERVKSFNAQWSQSLRKEPGKAIIWDINININK